MVFGSVAYLNKKCRRVGGEDEDMDETSFRELVFCCLQAFVCGSAKLRQVCFHLMQIPRHPYFFVYNMGHCMAYDRIGGW